MPNGPTRIIGAAHESIPIWNLGSLFADHTAYWENRDGFVLRVVRVCAETAKSPWRGALPDVSNIVDKRAAWRIEFLQMARWSSGLTWLVLGAFLWARYHESIPVPFDVAGWLPAGFVRFAQLFAFIVLAMWSTSGALWWLWSWWVLEEQNSVLGHVQPDEGSTTSFLSIGCMGFVVWVLINATYFLIEMDSFALKQSLTVQNALLRFLVVPFFLACVSPTILTMLNPPPSARASSGRESGS